MTLFQGLLAVLQKEFRHIRHDPLTLAITLGMPILQLVLFGFAVQARVERVPTAILNYDQHARSRALIQTLERSKLFLIEAYASTEPGLRQLLRAGRVIAAIEIPENFSSSELYRKPSTLRVWVDNSDALSSTQVTAAAQGLGVAESISRLIPGSRAMSQLPLVRVETSTLAFPDGGPRTAISLIPGLLGILVHTIPLLLMALSIVKEKERGTWEQTLATPISGWSLIGGKLTAYACVGFAEGCGLVVLMQAVFGIRVQGSLTLLLFSIGLFLIPSVGLGLLVTTYARHQAQALQMTYLLFLPSILITGFVFPRNAMPTPIYQISCMLPTTYFIRIVRGIVVRGATFQDLWSDYVAVFAFSALASILVYRTVKSIRA